ncbi:transglycosylase domain-containing protein [Salinicoccus hispanicus]|uniref:Penicillin-binding protein n=1 Tax=Salinicoccus hispanicus TaxID=157225 RepID=A0A6N8TXP0_9STAP|nr:transglycosylase domain-containing protein [Salinicoccus hispanicus]MXQ50500.1 penicillin-binding protein [Salinicoccus hispanicus]
MKKNNDFLTYIKNLFSRRDTVTKPDAIEGSTFKEKYNSVTSRFRKTGSPLRISFFTAYDTVWNIILFSVLTFTLLGILGLSIGLGYFAALVNDEEIQPVEEVRTALTEMTESTTVAFGSGESLGTLRADLIRERVDYDSISPYVSEALIATEDEYFYDHNGVVPKAFLRATLQQVAGSSSGTGGSTLTQQLVKNQLLTNETTFDRKATELLLAFRVEKMLSKEEILEAYLNAVSFGRNANGQNIAGIQAAAEGIFGKDAGDLNLAESAFIAGLPQNPYAYTPFLQGGTVKDPELLEAGQNRQRFVLERMLTEEAITQEEYEQALDYDLYANLAESVTVPNQNYPFLTDEIERRSIDILKYHLAEEDGLTREDVDSTPLINQQYTNEANTALRNQGYHIETTIDKTIYDTMQNVKDNSNYYYGSRSIADATDATEEEQEEEDEILEHEIGAVMKDNQTGKILGFIGGRDHDRSSINHATQTSRQAGSTMKPLITYGPAIDKGIIAPDTVLLDEIFTIPEIDYSPRNYDVDEEFGLVSAKHALSNSYNLSTLRLWADVRKENPQEYFEKMGIPLGENAYSDENTLVPSTPLGSHTMSVEDNANAFSTFANNGELVDSYMIESITSPEGETIYEHESESTQIFKDSTAYLMTDMLKETFQTGSAYYIQDYYDQVSDTYDWAAKTGTSNGFVDSWFMGYNPKVTLGVWMGYDRNIPQVQNQDSEQHMHIYNWRALAQAISEVAPEQLGANERFSRPSSVREVEYCALTMETEEDCELDLDNVGEGLIAEDTRLTDKDSLNDPEIMQRMGEDFDSELSTSDLRGTVTNSYDYRYSVGQGRSSSSDDDEDEDEDED